MPAEVSSPPAAGAGAPIKHTQLTQLVVSRLRDDILAGVLKPGERLTEVRVADQLQVSRVPVREALRALASEGLVEVRPRLGAVVASLKPSAAKEMIQIRATLEGLNARLAAENLTPELIEKIEAVLAKGTAMIGSDDASQLMALNAEFHDLLYAAGANGMLSDLMRSLRDRTRGLFVTMNNDEVRTSWEEHVAILRAVKDGDGTMAALLAERHVTRAAQYYLDRASRA